MFSTQLFAKQEISTHAHHKDGRYPITGYSQSMKIHFSLKRLLPCCPGIPA
jgi:hypothetical protein